MDKRRERETEREGIESDEVGERDDMLSDSGNVCSQVGSKLVGGKDKS